MCVGRKHTDIDHTHTRLILDEKVSILASQKLQVHNINKEGTEYFVVLYLEQAKHTYVVH